MATKPQMVDAIALTEKKMDMTLGMFLLLIFLNNPGCSFYLILLGFF